MTSTKLLICLCCKGPFYGLFANKIRAEIYFISNYLFTILCEIGVQLKRKPFAACELRSHIFHHLLFLLLQALSQSQCLSVLHVEIYVIH